MSFLRTWLTAWRRERNRKKRWAYRNRICWTWRDSRQWQREFTETERRARQS